MLSRNFATAGLCSTIVAGLLGCGHDKPSLALGISPGSATIYQSFRGYLLTQEFVLQRNDGLPINSSVWTSSEACVAVHEETASPNRGAAYCSPACAGHIVATLTATVANVSTTATMDCTIGP